MDHVLPRVSLGDSTELSVPHFISSRIYLKRTTSGSQRAVCQFLNACLDSDGMLYIPQFGEESKDMLEEYCALNMSRLKTFDNSTHPMQKAFNSRYHTGTHIITGHDMQPFQAHMPHLIKSLLHIAFKIAPFLQQNSSDIKGWEKKLCNMPNSSVHCVGSNLHWDGPCQCAIDPGQKLNVLVNKLRYDYKWANGLFHLIRLSSLRPTLGVTFGHELFPPKNTSSSNIRNGRESFARPPTPRRACFNSISILGRGPHDEIGENSLPDFGLQRAMPVRRTSARCLINVTIVNRPYQLKSTFWGTEPRRIVNVADLESELKGKAELLGVFPIITVVEELGSMSFLEQVDIMQNTQVLVSVHGAELANAIFLRRDVKIVELFPFRYTPVYFEPLLRPFLLRYTSSTAEPDEEGYRACIEKHFRPDNENNRNVSQAELIDVFSRHAELYRTASNTSLKELMGTHFGTSYSDRVCSRNQRLTIDAKFVANQALQEVHIMC